MASIPYSVLIASIVYFLTVLPLGTSYSHPTDGDNRLLSYPRQDPNRKPFQVFDAIGFMNKPDLFPIGLRLLPVLDFYEIVKSDLTPFGKPSETRQSMKYWPSVIPWILREQRPITWKGFWDKKPSAGEYLEGQPNIQRIRESARNLRKVPYQAFYLDIESEQFKQLQNKNQWGEAISILSTIIKEIKQEIPYVSLGYYSLMPSVNYWAPVSLQLEWVTCKQNGKCKNDSGVQWDEWNEKLRAWREKNRYFEELTQHVDMIFPSLYTPYLELCVTVEPGETEQKNSNFFPLHRSLRDRQCLSGNSFPNPVTEWTAWQASRQAWKAYAIANISEARKYHKPVYAFLWPQFHDETKACLEARKKQGDLTSPKILGCKDPGRDGVSTIPGDYWRFQLETVYELADGLVIWDYSKSKDEGGDWNDLTNCKNSSHWWFQTLDFLYDKGLSRLTPFEACKKLAKNS